MSYYHDHIEQVKKTQETLFNFIYLGKKGNLKVIDASDDTVNFVLEWRMKYWDGFDTKFKGTYNRTKQWLNSIYENKDRILFLIIYDGKKIGHIGLDGYDIDKNSVFIVDVLRGIPDVAPGLMATIEKKLIKWIFKSLKISTVKVRVFSDNYKGIAIHEKCGFIAKNSIPLKRKFNDDGWIWKPINLKSKTKFAERYFLLFEKRVS